LTLIDVAEHGFNANVILFVVILYFYIIVIYAIKRKKKLNINTFLCRFSLCILKIMLVV